MKVSAPPTKTHSQRHPPTGTGICIKLTCYKCNIISISITSCTSVWSYILPLHVHQMKVISYHIKLVHGNTIFRPSYIWWRLTGRITGQSVVFSKSKQRLWLWRFSNFWRHWEITIWDKVNVYDCAILSQLSHCNYLSKGNVEKKLWNSEETKISHIITTDENIIMVTFIVITNNTHIHVLGCSVRDACVFVDSALDSVSRGPRLSSKVLCTWTKSVHRCHQTFMT